MHQGKYVFMQLLDFIDKNVFLRLANKYDVIRFVKQFICWNQLAVMISGQLSNHESLRVVIPTVILPGLFFKSTEMTVFVLLTLFFVFKSTKTGLFVLLIGANGLCMGILCIFVGYI